MPALKYPGAAAVTAISADFIAAATSVSVDDVTGWPDGSTGWFVVTVNPGRETAEKMLVSSRAGNVLTINQRGYDGTTAMAHFTGERIYPTLDAASAQRWENHVFGLAQPHAADAVAVTPAGDIAATDVQAALEELDAEKVAKAGGTMTGALVLDDGHPAASTDYVDDAVAGVPGGTITGSPSGITVSVSDTAPSSPSANDVWIVLP
jgi:hypothetical protein